MFGDVGSIPVKPAREPYCRLAQDRLGRVRRNLVAERDGRPCYLNLGDTGGRCFPAKDGAGNPRRDSVRYLA